MILWLLNRKEPGQAITFSKVCFENREYALDIRGADGSTTALRVGGSRFDPEVPEFEKRCAISNKE